MQLGPLEKAIKRRQQLLAENADSRARIDKNTAEIAQLDAALAVMKRFAPAGLPGLDDDVSEFYGDLGQMTIPNAAATILYRRGEPLTTREILDVMVKAGKFPNTNNAMISLLAALNRNPHRFRKVDKTWELVDKHLPVLEVIESRAR